MNLTLVSNTETLEFMGKQIRLLICLIYECKYMQPLTIRRLYPVGYLIEIPLSTTERPYSIAIEAEGDSFWKLFKQALREANLSTILNFIILLHGGLPSCPKDILIDNTVDRNDTICVTGEILGTNLILEGLTFTTYGTN